MNGQVWVFAEHRDNEIVESSLELVCEARRLAEQLHEAVAVVLVGHGLENSAQNLRSYGVQTVFTADHKSMAAYRPEFYTAVLSGLARVHQPGILLLSASVNGQDLAARVAAKLKTSLASHCDRLTISGDGLLHQTRLMYENRIHATVASPGKTPQMATVTPGIAKIKKTTAPDAFAVVSVDLFDHFDPGIEKVKKLRFIPADPETTDISDAQCIVSGGKGASDEKGFQLIRDLADVLGASVAGSRVAVDNQWIGRQRQIGQSGKSVSPNLMISCGISGAGAHTFGMRDTRTLIAVNTDPAAPIMKIADLGVVGDLHAILPELIRRLKEKKLKENPHAIESPGG